MAQLLNPSSTTSTVLYVLYTYHHQPRHHHHNQPELEFLVREAHGQRGLIIPECSSCISIASQRNGFLIGFCY